MVGEAELSIVASSAVAEFVPTPLTVPSNSLVFEVEKFTSKSFWFGETVALDLIVRLFENAAKPIDKPTTATHKATIAIIFALRSLSMLSSFRLK